MQRDKNKMKIWMLKKANCCFGASKASSSVKWLKIQKEKEIIKKMEEAINAVCGQGWNIGEYENSGINNSGINNVTIDTNEKAAPSSIRDSDEMNKCKEDCRRGGSRE